MDLLDELLRSKQALRAKIGPLRKELQVEYHELRFRTAGYTLHAELHLLFPYEIMVGEAHVRATRLEKRLATEIAFPVQITTDLESVENHAFMHA